jgi:TolA-binding protein
MEVKRAARALCPGLFFVILPVLVLLSGCGRGGGASETYMEAEELLGRGKFLIAIEKYDTVARDYAETPFAPKSLYKQALIYNRFLKERQRAVEAYFKLLSLYPESGEAYAARRDLAAIYSATGDHTKAVEQYQWLLDSGREPAKEEDYRYTIALEYFRMNDFAQAGAELKELLAMASNREIVAKALLLQGDTFYITGDLEGAMKTYEEIISEFEGKPAELRARFNLARTLEEADREDEALKMLEGLRGRYPNEDAIERAVKGIKARKRDMKRKRRGRY